MDKCFYCNSRIEQPHTAEVGTDKQTVTCCSEDCIQKTNSFLQFFERKKLPFYIGIALSLVILFTGAFTIIEAKIVGAAFMGSALVLLGLTSLLTPFATPQTYQLFGIRKTTRITRIIGICVMLLGPVLVLLFIL